MMLIVSPSALSTMIELRIESGIDTAMISVLRQLPRKSRIISAVRHAAISASRSTPLIDARTNSDWSASGLISSSGGRLGLRSRGSSVLDVRDDVERRGVADLLDRQQRRALAVDADDVGLRREAVADVRDVADVDRVRADGLDRQIVQLLDRLRAGVQVDVVLGAADLRRAAGQDQVLQR